MLLTSIKALVTRPQAQADSLVQAIKDRGGSAWAVPMLTIEAIAENQAMRNTVLGLNKFDKVIVTSQHAARFGLALIDNYWPQLPVGQDWFAIGSRTQATLAYFGIQAQKSSNGHDSEALLSLQSLKSVNQQNILLLKGRGGRTLIADTLMARGAKIEQLESYQRKRPEYVSCSISDILQCKRINTLLCASGETVTNALHYLTQEDIARLYLVVPSQRIAREFSTLPFRQIIVSSGADHQATLAALETLERQAEVSNQINKHSEILS